MSLRQKYSHKIFKYSNKCHYLFFSVSLSLHYLSFFICILHLYIYVYIRGINRSLQLITQSKHSRFNAPSHISIHFLCFNHDLVTISIFQLKIIDRIYYKNLLNIRLHKKHFQTHVLDYNSIVSSFNPIPRSQPMEKTKG